MLRALSRIPFMMRLFAMPTPNRFRVFAALSTLAFYGMSVGCSTSPQAKEANYLKKGAELRDKKDYSRALLEFKNASLAMPKDAEPYYQMALTYIATGSIANAGAFFRKATEMNPK